MRIDNVGIAVRDLDAMCAFYADRLGLTVNREDDGDPRGAVVELEGAYLYVFETAGDAAGPARHPLLHGNRAGLDHISFTVEDVDAAHRELAARGLEFVEDPITREAWGMRVATFRDPEENLYFLVQHLGG